MRTISFFLFIFILAGCSSVTVEDCRNTDWISSGESDGHRGWGNNFSHWEKVCQKLGVQLDRKDYDRGYQKGLASYCSFDNGYLSGSEEHPQPQICRNELKEASTNEKKLEQKVEEKAKLPQRKTIFQAQSRPLDEKQRMSCHDDSDCRLSDDCKMNKCEKSGKACSSQYDCDVVGSCHFNKCSF